MADRIQARAVRRAGELLKLFDGKGRNQHTEDMEGTLLTLAPTQREAAEAAGLSEHQQKTAVRVANVPEEEFEAERPATVTTLAAMGKRSRQQSVTIAVFNTSMRN